MATGAGVQTRVISFTPSPILRMADYEYFAFVVHMEGVGQDPRLTYNAADPETETPPLDIWEHRASLQPNVTPLAIGNNLYGAADPVSLSIDYTLLWPVSGVRVADPTVVSDGVVDHIEESTAGGTTTLTFERTNSLSDLEISFTAGGGGGASTPRAIQLNDTTIVDDVTVLDVRGDDVSVISGTDTGEALLVVLPVEDRVFAGPPLGTPDAGDLFLFRDTDGTPQTELIDFTALQTALGTGGGGSNSVVAFRTSLNQVDFTADHTTWQHVLQWDSGDIAINEGGFTTEVGSVTDDTERLVIPEAGYYHVSASMFTTGNSGSRQSQWLRFTIERNGVETIQTQQGVIYSRQNTQAGQTSQTGQNELEVLYNLQADDRIGVLMRVEADSRDFTIVGASSFISAEKIGGAVGAVGPTGPAGSGSNVAANPTLTQDERRALAHLQTISIDGTNWQVKDRDVWAGTSTYNAFANTYAVTVTGHPDKTRT